MLASANRYNVGIVVFTREYGGRFVPNKRCTDATYFIGGDLFSIARSAKDNTKAIFSPRLLACDSFGSTNNKCWIVIVRIIGIGTMVNHLIALTCKVRMECGFKFEASVISGNVYFHIASIQACTLML